MKPRTINLKIGSKVLLRNEHPKKMDAPYIPKPMDVIGKKGSMITATDGFKNVSRNESLFKEVDPEMTGEGLTTSKYS